MTEFVNVPVPVDRVQEVYQLLARRTAHEGPRSSTAAYENLRDNDSLDDPGDYCPEGDSYAEQGEWTNKMLDVMVAESSARMKKILGVLGDCAPVQMSASAIAEEAGLNSAREVVAAMGPFAKRVYGRYGMKTLPFDSQRCGEERFFTFSMTPDIGYRVAQQVFGVKESEGREK